VLRILGLESLKLQRASALSPGRQRELELARVLAVQPDIVLLDEVMAGMTRDEQQTVRQVIRQLPDLGVHAVICVEHVISAVADLSDKMLVLDFGRKIAHDVPDKVLNDPAVVKAYLGDAGSGRRGMTDHDTAPGNSPQPERSNETAALTVESVSAGIGPLTILQDISFSVYPGEVVVILGANGAGKTTLLRVIAGLLPAREGQIHLYGTPIHRKPAHLVTRLGIGHVPSGRELFPKLSVADHLTLAGRLCAPERRADVRKRVLDMFPILEQQAHQLVGTMSGGQQQMVAIARALMTDPKVLLLDEPSTGLAPIAVTAVFETLPILRAHGVSTILAEQSLTLGLSHADRAFVMDHGHIVLSGTARELENDRRVIDTYLGR
jgi:ABC-type branched-subunit amino acid transport system ATPase component